MHDYEIQLYTAVLQLCTAVWVLLVVELHVLVLALAIVLRVGQRPGAVVAARYALHGRAASAAGDAAALA
eukprot:14448653-Heterocapsa_arctica.AAC.1